MLDDQIHIQQMAGTTTIGYVPMYNHIMELKDGHAYFTGSRSDKDYWNKQQLEFEKEVLRKGSHTNQIQKSGKGGKAHPAVAPGTSGNDSMDGRSARQRHNAHNRKAYNKHKKAKKEAAKLKAAAQNAGNSGNNKKPGQ